ncbi:S8 family serine peptidase [Actinophytocola sp.]|uniref:S8 family peptidase n=1 Tax=Actinophytocola sp. TaxID=1872138 RepID=UPI002ED4CF82
MRLFRLLAVPVIAVAAVATAPSAAAAPQPVAPAAVTATAPATITLITGDRVTVSTDSAGRTSVDVTPRPGGESLTYSTQQGDDGYFLFPSDAAPLVASGVLDRQLFNVNYLAENGYADNATAAVPVIVQYGQGLKASAVPGTIGAQSLPSINGAALDVAKDQVGAFWADLSGTQTARAGGVRKVWLDAKVEALDDVSNAQIGAPEAWAAGHDGTGATVGIIDTGVDGAHPDLANRIVEARNFVEPGFPGGGAPEDVTDRHGHGTHVASTVAGSGAASAGRYKGVAPGADLVIAKALDDNGNGTMSAIIAAMEWEASRKVDVISMSLGAGPTDGTDPLSTAVNELTAQYGTLFVIAAGNFGPGGFTVAAPGAATSALTVGAVDANDKIADFSSRGPRIGDLAIKPEITAPGVGIIAARATGTTMGRPLDDRYTAASGTSMATPHVAAAAGIIAAAHQDWTPEQLKAALVGTTKDVGLSAYEQGAGRLDLARAAKQTVVDDVSTIFTKVTHPYDGQAVTKTVTYRNTGTTPVALDLSVTMAHDGTPAPAGMATVSTPSVTVEPGATTTVDLTLDPTVAAPGWYDGRLTARDGTNHLAVPIALWLQAEQDTVRLQLIGDPSWTSMFATYVDTTLLSDTDPRFAGEPNTKLLVWRATDKPNVREATVSLARGGTYSLTTSLFWSKADRETQYGQVVEPELTVDGDRTVVLDATKLARVNVSTEQPSETAMASYFYYQSSAAGQLYTGGSVVSYPAIARGGYWISPTKKAPSIGDLGFISDETRIAPQVTLTAPGLNVHPQYVTDRLDILPKFSEDRRVGFATEQDLRAGKDVRGKLVYLTPTPLATFLSDVDLAVAHGAAGLLTNNHLAWVMTGEMYAEHMKIPLLWVNNAENAQLVAKLPRSAALHAELGNPYEYKAVHYLHDRIPAKIDIRMRDRDLARVDTTYHARFAPMQGRWGPVPSFTEVQHTFVPGQVLSVRGVHTFTAPGSRVEYYTVQDDVLWNRSYRFGDAVTGGDRNAMSWRGFTRGTRETEDWNETVVPIQTLAGPALPGTGQAQVICDNCRQGDRLRLRSLGSAGFAHFADADPSHQYAADLGATEEIRLYRDGTELTPAYDVFGLPYYDVPEKTATYRLTDVYKSAFSGEHGGKTVTTDWTFRSGRPASGTVTDPYACIDSALFNDKRPCAWQPLLQLTHDLDVAADDTARAGRPFTFTVRARVGDSVVPLREVKVWISADGGKHWTRTTVNRTKDNAYRGSVINPRTAGAITIRTEATDRNGNSVRQTVSDAYLVR